MEFYRELKSVHLKPNVITYTVLIDNFCKEGRTDDAILLFQSMLDDGIKANVVFTFIFDRVLLFSEQRERYYRFKSPD